MSSRKSGLQKEVISLYRRALRIPRTKPPPTRPKWELMLRYTFRKNAASVSSPRAISVIEHLLRTGRRQVSMYEDKSVKDCWVSDEMREWDAQQKQKLNPSSQ